MTSIRLTSSYTLSSHTITRSIQGLVRWKDFDVSHDSWVQRKFLTPLALQAYERFLTEHVWFCEERSENSKLRSANSNRKLKSPSQQLKSARERLLSFTDDDRYSVLKTSSSSRAPTTLISSDRFSKERLWLHPLEGCKCDFFFTVTHLKDVSETRVVLSFEHVCNTQHSFQIGIHRWSRASWIVTMVTDIVNCGCSERDCFQKKSCGCSRHVTEEVLW